MSSLRRLLSALTLVSCALGLLAGAAGAWKSKHHRAPRVSHGSRYLALGDSVTFGYQESTVVPPPDYPNASSFLGYPEHLAAQLHLRVANAACPGETSASLINASAPSNGCENAPPGHHAYRQSFPLHVRYKGSQLAYAVKYLRHHRHVRLVSLMIGANDLFRCQSTTPDACLSPAEQNAVMASIAKNVRTILSAVRHRGRYRGQLAIVNYYSLDYSSPFVTAIVARLNQTVDSAAKRFHVETAHGFAKFRAASLRSGNNPCTAGLLTQLGRPGKCGVHPSYAGQVLLAQALQQAIRF